MTLRQSTHNHMLLAELKTRRQVVLQEQAMYRYILYEATRQETDELYIEMEKRIGNFTYKSENFDFLDKVDFFGESHDVNHYHIKDIIPTEKVHVIKGESVGRSETIHESKCYQDHKEKNKFNNIIIHEDKLSSFKCACELAKATSFIVLKEPRYIVGIDPYEPIKKQEDGTDNSGDTTTHS